MHFFSIVRSVSGDLSLPPRLPLSTTLHQDAPGQPEQPPASTLLPYILQFSPVTAAAVQQSLPGRY